MKIETRTSDSFKKKAPKGKRAAAMNGSASESTQRPNAAERRKAKRERLEQSYWKAGIAAAIIAALSLIVTVAGLFINSRQDTVNTADTQGSHSPATVVTGENNKVTNDQSVQNENYYFYGESGAEAASGQKTGDEEIKDPDSFENDDRRLAYAADLYEKGCYRDAIDFLDAFKQMEPLDGETKTCIDYDLAICCLANEDYNLAVNYLEDVLEVVETADIQYSFARACAGAKDTPRAIAAINRAIELDEREVFIDFRNELETQRD